MPTFEQRYSAEQKEAVWRAYLDDGDRPLRAILGRLERGELRLHGELVPAIDMTHSTAAKEVNRERARRRGRAARISNEAPRDALEQLRRRMVVVADKELEKVERISRGKGKVDLARAREIVRLLREIAALPEPTDDRPVAPGEHDPKHGNPTTNKPGPNSLAGRLLAAHRATSGTVQTPRDTTASEHPSKPEREAETDQREAVRAFFATAAEQNSEPASSPTSPGSGEDDALTPLS